MKKKNKTKNTNLKKINKISTKLVLIFTLIILLLLFIWGFGLFNINKINTANRKLYLNNTLGISYINLATQAQGCVCEVHLSMDANMHWLREEKGV